MPLKYASVGNIAKRMSPRINVVQSSTNSQVMGITGTSIGTELITLAGEGIEEFADIFLGMIYEMPLKLSHPFLNSIVEKMIVAEVYSYYFPSGGETGEATESFPKILRQQALDEFQILFDGLGIFVPGSTNQSTQLQNDENKQQQAVKVLILTGETVKPYIGYDYNGDSVSDTDLFKLNANVQPSFYTTGDFDKLDGEDIINNVRVRPRDYRQNDVDVDFW